MLRLRETRRHQKKNMIIKILLIIATMLFVPIAKADPFIYRIINQTSEDVPMTMGPAMLADPPAGQESACSW